MRYLLNNRSFRHLILLEMLYDKGWLTTKSMSQKLGLAERLIRSDLEDLNCNANFFKLEYSRKKGFCIRFFSNYSKNAIYMYILRDSTEFRLLEMLAFNVPFSACKLCEELYISKSTLNRLVHTLNEKLSVCNIHITSSPFKICGDELRIRQFLINLVLEKYQKSSAVFSTEKLTFSNELLALYENKITKISNINREKLKVGIIVACIRTSNNHYIDMKPINDNDLFKVILDNPFFVAKFQALFDLEIQPQSLQQVFAILYDSREKDIKQVNMEAENNGDSLFFDKDYCKCDEFLMKLSSKLEIEIPNREFVLQELFNEMNRLYKNNGVLFNKHKDFITDVTIEITDFYRVFSKVFREFFNQGMYSEELIYKLSYCVLIRWENLIKDLKKKRVVKICLYFNCDERHQLFLADYIKQEYKDECSLVILREEHLKNIKKNRRHYNLVLTDVNGLYIENTDVITFSFFPDKKKWGEIEESIHKVR